MPLNLLPTPAYSPRLNVAAPLGLAYVLAVIGVLRWVLS
jgi:hypothetical protein